MKKSLIITGLVILLGLLTFSCSEDDHITLEKGSLKVINSSLTVFDISIKNLDLNGETFKEYGQINANQTITIPLSKGYHYNVVATEVESKQKLILSDTILIKAHSITEWTISVNY